ncbi:MAG: putative photosynthetic complex assembly protein PuhE [Hyphomicrobium sp.]
MALYVMPVMFALFAWWFSTGLVLYVVGRPRATHAKAMWATTALLAAGLWGLSSSATDTSVSGAYIAFASALLVWGWHEMAFLLGFITGPRTTPCPEKTSGRAPLGASIEVVIYHEFAIALTAALIYVLTIDAPNQIGLWTFVILWLARLSTKFNIYLGVPNHTEQFLPTHLKYLATYFCRRSMNLLFPVTVTATTLITATLIGNAADPSALPHQVAGSVFLATLMGLAVLEHWFLVLPLPSAELWTWGLASRRHETLQQDGCVAATGINA